MSENPLGKTTEYIDQYAPQLLFAIARSEKRGELESHFLKFNGQDIWNAYEISWLNANGLPQVAIGEFRVSAESEFIVESKSLKLYLNSFNQTKFDSKQDVEDTIARDLSLAAAKAVDVRLYSPKEFSQFQVENLTGELIDDSQVKIDNFSYQPELLASSIDNSNKVSEKLVSHLLKSNCLITSQPDWASIQITYQGSKIDRDRLLKYLISFRSHNEFHEQCVERIFSDIKKFCQPDKLTVYARYTRRGGLDINPWRSDFEYDVSNIRLARQ
jgi:7-cyano-7-deazaguanine reductase